MWFTHTTEMKHIKVLINTSNVVLSLTQSYKNSKFVSLHALKGYVGVEV